MADPRSSIDAREAESGKHRMSLLRKLKTFKTSSEEIHQRESSHSLVPIPPRCSRLRSVSGIEEPLSNTEILQAFCGLHDAILTHVNKFYSTKQLGKGVSQAVIEHASTGIMLPWPQILSLLGDTGTRINTLALCIAWTILSRSLLLKLGVSNSPGSTFLPPEIVECFQSISLGKAAVSLGKDKTHSVDFALLSRWKQITATLLHSTYVEDAFSHFDSRTVNMERALQDLDPLLATYATPHDGGHGMGTRLNDLREVLRKGAKFAFMLFSQPAFWKFDWKSDRAAAHGKSETERDPERAPSIASIGAVATSSIRLTESEIVVWPCLVRAMDEEGVRLEKEGEEGVIGEKKYLADGKEGGS